MRVYEEYATPQEKRAAQRGAERGKVTGKARGYLVVTEQMGIENCHALGELLSGSQPGDGPQVICNIVVGRDHLAAKCRRVGFGSLPEEWKQAFTDFQKGKVPSGWKQSFRHVDPPH